MSDLIVLASIYEEIPDDTQLLWAYVDEESYLNEPFDVVLINPMDWVNRVDAQGQTLLERFNWFSSQHQQDLVAEYRRIAPQEAARSYIVVASEENMVIDGQHRLIAYAMERIEAVRAVDLRPVSGWSVE